MTSAHAPLQALSEPAGDLQVSRRFTAYVAILTAILTLITFAFAIIAIPISGANCLGDCIQYPYLNTVSQFPRDFIWLPLAVIQVLFYMVLMSCLHSMAPQRFKIFSQAGLSFALLSAAILAGNYFLQFNITPISLMNNETQGLPLLIQYNPHGVFIALEELGYLLMSFSFLCMAPVFLKQSRLEAIVGWIFAGAFILALLAFIVFTWMYGIDRQDRFEIVIISIDWLTLLINGFLLGVIFRRKSNHAEMSV